jgi:hypothetical protein
LVNPFKIISSRIQANRQKKEYQKASYQYYQKLVQAMTDGNREASILTPEVLEELYNAVKQPDKNNYKTYASQIQAIYKMYYNESNYGGEILRGIIDTRTAILCGEGLNAVIFDSPEFLEEQEKKEKEKKVQVKEMPIQSLEEKPKENIVEMPLEEPQTEQEIEEEEIIDEKKEQVKEFINNFVKWNKLEGEGLIEIGECAEMEGKVLLVLNPGILNGKKIIKIDVFDYYSNNYNIQYNENGEIIKITYGNKSNPKSIPLERAIFIQFSGKKKDFVKTPPRIANVLTQIENYSRAKYDLRKNNHLFAKTTPFFKTVDSASASPIKNDIQSKKWVIGMGYAGAADFSYVSQSPGASDSIEKERIMDMKDIATTVGIPILLMNYPELMSNRATADTMMEMLNQSSKKERLKMQSGMIELFQKAMAFAEKQKIEGAINEPDMFDINIPLITLDNLKSLIETWCVLMDKKIISKKTVQGKVPGINPLDEEKQIQEETKENIANNPIVQGTMNDIMQEAKGKAGEKIIDQTNKKIQSYRRKKHVRKSNE